jgi:hypothetical protein
MDKATLPAIILYIVYLAWLAVLVLVTYILTPKKKRTVHGSTKPIDGKNKKEKKIERIKFI